MSSNPQSSAYRPDIDGLRAIAVVAVCLFHAGVPGFSGGFVGVDVFFVISGYLTARTIARAHSTGSFSSVFGGASATRSSPAPFLEAPIDAGHGVNRELQSLVGADEFFDPDGAFCPKPPLCRFQQGTSYLFVDQGHYSHAGSLRAVEALQLSLMLGEMYPGPVSPVPGPD